MQVLPQTSPQSHHDSRETCQRYAEACHQSCGQIYQILIINIKKSLVLFTCSGSCKNCFVCMFSCSVFVNVKIHLQSKIGVYVISKPWIRTSAVKDIFYSVNTILSCSCIPFCIPFHHKVLDQIYKCEFRARSLFAPLWVFFRYLSYAPNPYRVKSLKSSITLSKASRLYAK